MDARRYDMGTASRSQNCKSQRLRPELDSVINVAQKGIPKSTSAKIGVALKFPLHTGSIDLLLSQLRFIYVSLLNDSGLGHTVALRAGYFCKSSVAL